MSNSFLITDLGAICLYATQDGFLFAEGESQARNAATIRPEFQTLVGMLKPWEVAGIVQRVEGGYSLDYEGLMELEKQVASGLDGVDVLACCFESANLNLLINAKGTIGRPGFEFVFEFNGPEASLIENAIGPIVVISRKVKMIRARQAMAIVEILRFQRQSTEARSSKVEALLCLNYLRTQAKENGISFSSYLDSEKVVVVDRVSVGVTEEEDSISFYPIAPNVPEEVLKKSFLNRNSADRIYDLVDGKNARLRVLATPEVQSVFKAIRTRGNKLAGDKKEAALRNPEAIFSEGAVDLEAALDLSGLGPRVRGIGIFASAARPTVKTNRETWMPEVIGLELAFSDGHAEVFDFENVLQARAFLEGAELALAEGKTSIKSGDRDVPVTAGLIEALQRVVFSLEKGESVKEEVAKRNVLLIFDNDEEVQYAEDLSKPKVYEPPRYLAPKSLKPSVDLKRHQREAVAWLQGLVQAGQSRGCLLADDMGLGKTLQILSFLAWCIESEEFKADLGAPRGPYKPILVVAPVTLINNWMEEMERFFDGQVFQPYIPLHSKKLASIRLPEASGAELELAKPTLDLSQIKAHRVVLTNYETVRNYQHSLARIEWSILVLDEAQEIKEPATGVTLATKALNPKFRIASTGTPVENDLLDLWSIMDFLQPGQSLVGSQREFLKTYNIAGPERSEKSVQLKLRLGLNDPKGTGHVLRRLKRHILKDLPPKHVHRLSCDLSARQRELYLSVVAEAKANRKQKGAILKALQALSLICQHPFLASKEDLLTGQDDPIGVCPKLAEVIKILHQVKASGEKALIFARSLQMQEILARAIGKEFNLRVDILNGATRASVGSAGNTRAGLIKSFSERIGFNVIVLSPEVAGVGLTITEANHVVHYGRWWNPAKENQATDRAYRIGQLREVNVHYLICRDPMGEFETFDEKLDRLIRDKEQLAEDFLAPALLEMECFAGLADDVFGEII